MDLDEIKEKTEKSIKKLIKEFKLYPDKFLTEEDVRAYLYHLLLEDFGRLEETEEGSKSIPVHNEIRWLGSSGRLRFRSDIVIFDVSSLITKNRGEIRIHSKGYGFGRPYILIEIKLRRNKKGSDRKFLNQIKRDRERIIKIKEDITIDFYSYILAFDKKRKIEFIKQEDPFHKEFYEGC